MPAPLSESGNSREGESEMKAVRAFPVFAILVAGLVSPVLGQEAPKLDPHEGDFTIPNFQFVSGETLSRLRLHYTTLGTPIRDARGRGTNAVLIMHGTGGDE